MTIDKMQGEYPIQQLCQVLSISRSSYYDWRRSKTYQIGWRLFVFWAQMPYPISPNVLKEKGFPGSINEIWVGDITYIPMAGGTFRYLSVWMDLYSRKIVGWDPAGSYERVVGPGLLAKGISVA